MQGRIVYFCGEIKKAKLLSPYFVRFAPWETLRQRRGGKFVVPIPKVEIMDSKELHS